MRPADATPSGAHRRIFFAAVQKHLFRVPAPIARTACMMRRQKRKPRRSEASVAGLDVVQGTDDVHSVSCRPGGVYARADWPHRGTAVTPANKSPRPLERAAVFVGAPSLIDTLMRRADALVTPKSGVMVTLRGAGRRHPSPSGSPANTDRRRAIVRGHTRASRRPSAAKIGRYGCTGPDNTLLPGNPDATAPVLARISHTTAT
jgi:hypothetical protein